LPASFITQVQLTGFRRDLSGINFAPADALIYQTTKVAVQRSSR
jgi:hypothetical protein